MLMSVYGIKCDQIQVSQGHGGHCAVSAQILPPQLMWFLEGIIVRDKSCLMLLRKLETSSPRVYLPRFVEDLREQLMG